MHFRPDWEAVVTPAIDYALTLPEVDAQRLALVGMSLGGYLAARAAAFEHRLAACVLYDGVWDLHDTVQAAFHGTEDAPGGFEGALSRSVSLRWVVDNGLWTFGVSDADALLEASRAYSIEDVVGRISCPTLVLDAENDLFFAGQPERVFDALTCPKEYLFFPEAEGGGEHCHEGAIAVFHQRTFDWLDTVLA